MNIHDDKQLYEDSKLVYNIDGQIGQIMEECGELITAANQHFWRDRIPVEEFIEEMADVQIMLNQFRNILGEEYVDEIMQKKYERYKDRVKEKTDKLWK